MKLISWNVNGFRSVLGKGFGDFFDAADADMHDILLCIQTGKLRSDPNRMRFANDQFYLKTEAEMAKLFPDVPEADRI